MSYDNDFFNIYIFPKSLKTNELNEYKKKILDLFNIDTSTYSSIECIEDTNNNITEIRFSFNIMKDIKRFDSKINKVNIDKDQLLESIESVKLSCISSVMHKTTGIVKINNNINDKSKLSESVVVEVVENSSINNWVQFETSIKIEENDLESLLLFFENQADSDISDYKLSIDQHVLYVKYQKNSSKLNVINCGYYKFGKFEFYASELFLQTNFSIDKRIVIVTNIDEDIIDLFSSHEIERVIKSNIFPETCYLECKNDKENPFIKGLRNKFTVMEAYRTHTVFIKLNKNVDIQAVITSVTNKVTVRKFQDVYLVTFYDNEKLNDFINGRSNDIFVERFYSFELFKNSKYGQNVLFDIPPDKEETSVNEEISSKQEPKKGIKELEITHKVEIQPVEPQVDRQVPKKTQQLDQEPKKSQLQDSPILAIKKDENDCQEVKAKSKLISFNQENIELNETNDEKIEILTLNVQNDPKIKIFFCSNKHHINSFKNFLNSIDTTVEFNETDKIIKINYKKSSSNVSEIESEIHNYLNRYIIKTLEIPNEILFQFDPKSMDILVNKDENCDAITIDIIGFREHVEEMYDKIHDYFYVQRVTTEMKVENYAAKILKLTGFIITMRDLFKELEIEIFNTDIPAKVKFNGKRNDTTQAKRYLSNLISSILVNIEHLEPDKFAYISNNSLQLMQMRDESNTPFWFECNEESKTVIIYSGSLEAYKTSQEIIKSFLQPFIKRKLTLDLEEQPLNKVFVYFPHYFKEFKENIKKYGGEITQIDKTKFEITYNKLYESETNEIKETFLARFSIKNLTLPKRFSFDFDANQVQLINIGLNNYEIIGIKDVVDSTFNYISNEIDQLKEEQLVIPMKLYEAEVFQFGRYKDKIAKNNKRLIINLKIDEKESSVDIHGPKRSMSSVESTILGFKSSFKQDILKYKADQIKLFEENRAKLFEMFYNNKIEFTFNVNGKNENGLVVYSTSDEAFYDAQGILALLVHESKQTPQIFVRINKKERDFLISTQKISKDDKAIDTEDIKYIIFDGQLQQIIKKSKEFIKQLKASTNLNK